VIKRIPAWLWAILTFSGVFFLGWLDILTGYDLNFFVFYYIPIAIGAWFLGTGAATALSVSSALMWGSADVLSGHVYTSPLYGIWNTMIRLIAFLAIGWTVSRVRALLDQEHETTETLRQTLSEIKVLETFLPICAQCKKIRDQNGEWQHLEIYIGNHSKTTFSHGFCPDCARKTLEVARILQKSQKES